MSRTRSPKKYHPIRFYVINTEVPRILISHAASFWLGLVKVLCDNKAPWIKRQVASIDKKSNFRAKDGPKMTSMQRLGSSSQKRESSSKTVTSVGVSRWYTDRHHGRAIRTGQLVRQIAICLIFMSTLYNGLARAFPPLVNYWPPACMYVPCIILRINPRVNLYMYVSLIARHGGSSD